MVINLFYFDESWNHILMAQTLGVMAPKTGFSQCSRGLQLCLEVCTVGNRELHRRSQRRVQTTQRCELHSHHSMAFYNYIQGITINLSARRAESYLYVQVIYKYVAMSESELMNDPADVNGPDDVSFPNHTHHFQVRSELTQLVKKGCLTNEEADEAYDTWKEQRNQ